MAPFAKPFLPVDAQIALLKTRGMAIADEAKAKLCLERIGYYRLSAYWYPFREFLLSPTATGRRADTFVAGTSFEEVFRFYVFDKELRLLVLDALERIEIALRADIANLLGARDPLAHRNPSLLDRKFVGSPGQAAGGLSRHQEWLRRMDEAFDRSKEDFAVHFRRQYGGSCPPIWIAKEVWDWGMLSHFFAGMKPVDKDTIAGKFGALTGRHLETWVRAMNDVRNICAHHSRLWNRGLVVTPSLPAAGRMPGLDHIPRDDRYLSRLYTALVLMRILLLRIHPNNSELHRRIAEHAKGAPTNPIISANTAGFPPGWEQQAVWQ